MSLVDCLLMTLVNAVICISLPKLISLLQQQQKVTEMPQSDLTAKTDAAKPAIG
jgi:hypothetical protein